MEKSRRQLLFSVVPIVFLLFFPLIFAYFFGKNIIPFNQWMQNSREIHKTIEEAQPLKDLLARLVRGEDLEKLETTGFACDVAEHSIVCVTNKPVRIDCSNITVHIPSNIQKVQEEIRVKPYARQADKYLLQYITPVRILHGDATPPACQFNHKIPAVFFSSGLTGNLFHEFNDIIIPLFITTKHFQTRVFGVLEDYNPTFMSKYSKIMSRLFGYGVMNPAANGSVHCFPGSVIGLKYHDNLALNSSDIPGGYSTSDFRQFLRETYDLKFRHVSQIRKPTLMLISREKSRRILNEDEIMAMIKEVGFQVVLATAQELSNLNKSANVVNSCSVLVGVHGAGLTNELFLPAEAVMVQVQPLGLEWASTTYFGKSASAMDLHYLLYKTEPEESSLVEMYGRNHSVITDPTSVFARGYRAARAVYIDQQNIRINIMKFRDTIVRAFQLVGNSSFAG